MFASNAARFVGEMVQAAEQFFTTSRAAHFDARFGPATVRITLPADETELLTALSSTMIPANTTSPDFVVSLIDERHGATRPTIPWPSTAMRRNGVVRVDPNERVDIAFEGITKSVNVLDRRSHSGVVLLKSVRSYLQWAMTCPLRPVLGWIADVLHGELVHAAVIRSGDVGIAIIGPSGLGKSTLSISASVFGRFSLVSDDFVLVSETLEAFPFYRNVRLGEVAVRELGLTFDSAKSSIVFGKRILPFGSCPKLRTVDAAKVDCIVLPVRDQDEDVLIAPHGAILPDMFLHSLAGTLGGNERSLSRMGELVSSRPGFMMRLSPDWRDNLARLDEIVRRAASR